MSRYIDLNNPKIMKMGRNKFGDVIYHIPPDLPLADVVDKEQYDKLLENSTIISKALSIYQAADMVEVVRCIDCKYYNGNERYCEIDMFARDYGYCYKAKRREDE